MLVEEDALMAAAARCRQAAELVVFGGPLPLLVRTMQNFGAMYWC